MSSALNIRCIIVDDEPLAVTLLTDYVARTPGLETVLATTHVLEALFAVQEGKADLLLLDIQMPELTGIQLMKIIRNTCKVILITAYPEYAMEGYAHDVVDYLLKPVTFDRFIIAAEKAKQRIRPTAPVSMPAVAAMTDHIFIKTEYRIRKIDLQDIAYIESLRDYIAIHTVTEKILSLDSMRNMEEILPAQQFIRIHKSYIINRSRIDYIERSKVVMGEQRLPIGDTYREKLLEKLGIR